jgi:hypothetical protein
MRAPGAREANRKYSEVMATMTATIFSVTTDSSRSAPRPVSLAVLELARSSVVYSAAMASRSGSGRTMSFSIGIPSTAMTMSIWVSGTRDATFLSASEKLLMAAPS